MTRILKIGMDVHSKSYSLCAMEVVNGSEDRVLKRAKVPPDYTNILQFIESVKNVEVGLFEKCDIECGYEAGCLGYSLYHKLTAAKVKCVILAPTTMLTPQRKRVKTDERDAQMIAEALIHRTYKKVHVPSKEDIEIKEYIRMKADFVIALKKLKQQINSFCLRHGYMYEKSKWTLMHLKWLRDIELSYTLRETLNEYLASYYETAAKIERFNQKIEEFATDERYQKSVKRLCCLLGIKTNTALAIITEVGDARRFPNANAFASYLGLVPGESSSGEHICRTGITKAGNNDLRRLLVEAAQGLCHGAPGYKSKTLKARQNGNPSEIIAYADSANYRLRRKYYRQINKGKNRNVVITAIARELACFIWGMLTENIQLTAA